MSVSRVKPSMTKSVSKPLPSGHKHKTEWLETRPGEQHLNCLSHSHRDNPIMFASPGGCEEVLDLIAKAREVDLSALAARSRIGPLGRAPF